MERENSGLKLIDEVPTPLQKHKRGWHLLSRRVTRFGNSARVKALEHKMLTCLHGRSQGDN
jgi:hypothetical protein